MSRYIDADKINDKLMDEYHGMIFDESMKIYKIMQMLDNAPTADVQEVKHSKWEYYGEYVQCCNCKHSTNDFYIDDEDHMILPHYCSRCGANMKDKR